MKQIRGKIYRDFSKGTWGSIQSSLAPTNSVKLALNLDSDNEMGSLVSRNGTTILGVRFIGGPSCYGLHNYRQSVGSVTKLFVIFSDGAIRDALTEEITLVGDTAELKTRFLTYLDSCLRLNGFDSAKYFNGTSWIGDSTGANFTAATTDIITSAIHGLLDGDLIILSTTDTLPAGLDTGKNYYVIDKTTDTFKVSLTSGGDAVDITDTGTGTHTWAYADTFDILNIPTKVKYAIEFKDRIYVAGDPANPDRIDYSGIADSTTRTVSWTVDNGFIVFEQEDGGGGITGLAKVPGYILIFKKRTLKRYDGISAYPESMINQGAPSQEAITTAQGMCFWVNENGAWASTGGVPQKISTFTVDKIIKSCSATNLENVFAGTDEEHIFWSFPSVTIDGETYTNVVLKFNILQNSWDVRKYDTLPRFFTRFVDSDKVSFTVFGDNDGKVQKMDVGNTDNGTPITWSFEGQDWDFGSRLFKKSINRFGVFTDGISNATVLWRDTNKPEDWKPIGTIRGDITDIDGIDIEANYYNFKITSSVDSGQVKILGFEFPDGIKLYDNSTT